jgi:hypothetical protein
MRSWVVLLLPLEAAWFGRGGLHIACFVLHSVVLACAVLLDRSMSAEEATRGGGGLVGRVGGGL